MPAGMPYMYALHDALYVCRICMPYMYALYACLKHLSVLDHARAHVLGHARSGIQPQVLVRCVEGLTLFVVCVYY